MTPEGDSWVFRFEVPAEARLEYKFVIDGVWRLDEANPKRVDNGVGGFNSVWEGRAWRASAPLDAPKVPLRRVAVYVPGPDAQPRQGALYVPKGEGLLPLLLYADGQEYETRLKAPVILAHLIAARRVRPVAMLLVPSGDRMKEYGSDSRTYEAFVVGPLLEEARRRGAVSLRAEDVFVGGASLGGLIALRLAQNHPDKIAGGVHSQSGAFWAAPELLREEGLGQDGLDAADFPRPGALRRRADSLERRACQGFAADGPTVPICHDARGAQLDGLAEPVRCGPDLAATSRGALAWSSCRRLEGDLVCPKPNLSRSHL